MFILELVDKLKHERIHRIGPLVILKEKELKNKNANKSSSLISNAPSQTLTLTPNTNILATIPNNEKKYIEKD